MQTIIQITPTPTISSKNHTIMRDIVTKYHPQFANDTSLSAYGLSQPEIFNVERLVEHTLAAVGGYRFIDIEGQDFDDSCNSDSKTVSVNSNTGKAEVQNVDSKIGALRITVYNPVRDKLDFIYIPTSCVEDYSLPCYGKKKDYRRMIMTYTRYGDHYNKFEKFRLKSFQDLAQANDNDWWQRKYLRY